MILSLLSLLIVLTRLWLPLLVWVTLPEFSSQVLLFGQLSFYHGGDAPDQVQQSTEGHRHGIALWNRRGLHLVQHLKTSGLKQKKYLT